MYKKCIVDNLGRISQCTDGNTTNHTKDFVLDLDAFKVLYWLE